MNRIKTVRRDIGAHDRHSVGVEAHRAGHAVDQCTRLPGPVPTHSGLPGSHLQPQDHPAARRRTGFVPVVRTVPAADNPGLWLLDMVRRAAAGLPQAEGTGFLPAGQAKQSDPPGRSQSKDPTSKKKHPLRVLLAVLGILALAAFGVAWYLTDGDLAALPQRLKTLHLPEWVTLWQAHEPKPGARLI